MVVSGRDVSGTHVAVFNFLGETLDSYSGCSNFVHTISRYAVSSPERTLQMHQMQITSDEDPFFKKN